MPSHVNLQTKNYLQEHQKILQERLKELKTIKGLVGIVLNGGLSRGYSDEYSEIDLLIYLDQQYVRYYQTNKTPYEIGITMHQGQLYDISLVSYQEEQAKDWDSLMCWDRSHAEILYEEDKKITKLYQEKLKQTPPTNELSGLLFSAYWYISITGDLWIHRKDTMQGHHLFNQAMIPLVKCLFLVNNEHIPHEKWLLHLSKTLEKRPQNYEELLTQSMLIKDNTLSSLKTRQEKLKILYHEVDKRIKEQISLPSELDATYQFHFSVLDYLLKHQIVKKQDFLEKFGISILNTAPFHQCVTIKEDKVILDIDKLTTLDPSDAYAWFYQLVEYAKNYHKETI